MLLVAQVIFLLFASAAAEAPPGYAKPLNAPNKVHPKYEYGYNIEDHRGDSHGKLETRDGIYALGRYYTQGADSSSNVQYYADDWGFHPFIEYGNVGPHSRSRTQLLLGVEAVKALASNKFTPHAVPAKQHVSETINSKLGAQPQPQAYAQPQPQQLPQPQPQLLPQQQLLPQPQPQALIAPAPQVLLRHQPQALPAPQPQIHVQPQPKVVVHQQPQLYVQPQPQVVLQHQPQVVVQHQQPEAHVVVQPQPELYVQQQFVTPQPLTIHQNLINAQPQHDEILIQERQRQESAVIAQQQALIQQRHREESQQREQVLRHQQQEQERQAVTQQLIEQHEQVALAQQQQFLEARQRDSLAQQQRVEQQQENVRQNALDSNLIQDSNRFGARINVKIENQETNRLIESTRNLVSGQDVLNINSALIESSTLAPLVQTVTAASLLRQPIVVADFNEHIISTTARPVVVEVQKSLPYYLGNIENNIQIQGVEQKSEQNLQLSKSLSVDAQRAQQQQSDDSITIESSDSINSQNIKKNCDDAVELSVQTVQSTASPIILEKVIEKEVPITITKIIERPVEITKIVRTPVPIQVPVHTLIPVEKHIPVAVPVERIVEKPVKVTEFVEKRVHVPQPYPVEKIVEKQVRVPVEVTKYVDRPYAVQVPVAQPVPYPVDRIVEKIVQQPYPVEVPVAVERIIEKKVPVGNYLPSYALPLSYSAPKAAYSQPIKTINEYKAPGKSNGYLPPAPPCEHNLNAYQSGDIFGLEPPRSSNRRFRNARSNFNSDVRLEYGFMPPLIPSLEIDEHGQPIGHK